MIVCYISEALGNQMFLYASVKSFCIDKGYEFRYFRPEKNIYGNADLKFGRDIETVFKIPVCERITKLPEGLNEISIKEQQLLEEKVLTDFDIGDQTYLKSFIWSPKTFIHRIEEVRKWFEFPEKIRQDVNKYITGIRKKFPDRTLVAVHFRTWFGYYGAGGVLDYHYWSRAAQKAENTFQNKKPIYVVFCDKKMGHVKKFIAAHECIESINHSLVFDMCAISECDAAIICNSTFSTWGALLGQDMKKVYCPSIVPLWGRITPTIVFADEWERVDAKVDWKSAFLWRFNVVKRRVFFQLINIRWLRKLLSPLSVSLKEKIVSFCARNHSDSL